MSVSMSVSIKTLINLLKNNDDKALANEFWTLVHAGAGKTKANATTKAKGAAVAVADIPKPDFYLVDHLTTGGCLARKRGRTDTRWKPAVFFEAQCGKKIKAGTLCDACERNRSAFEDGVDLTKWLGVVGEAPLAHVKMIGTAWADAKNPVFKGGELPPPKVRAPSKKAKATASSAASVVTGNLPEDEDDSESSSDLDDEEEEALPAPTAPSKPKGPPVASMGTTGAASVGTGSLGAKTVKNKNKHLAADDTQFVAV